jgi:hypothetical protein
VNDIETESDCLQADLQILLAEIDRAGPPDSTPGPFAPNGDYERLVTRWWETRRKLALTEMLALNRTLLDSMRTVRALDGIMESRLESAKSQKLARVELTGLKVSADQFDELGISLRRAQLEKDFRTALRQANGEREL